MAVAPDEGRFYPVRRDCVKVVSYFEAPDNNGVIYTVEHANGSSADIKVTNDDSGLMYVMDPADKGIDETEALLAVTAYLDSRIDGEVSSDETEYGEPRYWLNLPNGRSIEVCHEENGLPEDRQYWSFRLHCSEDEFEEGRFSRTMGVIAQQFSDKAANLNSRICISRLARIA